MRLQRVRVAGNRIEMQVVKWTAEGMFCREYGSINSVNQGGTAGM